MNNKTIYVILILVGIALVVIGVKKDENIVSSIGGFLIGIFGTQLYLTIQNEKK